MATSPLPPRVLEIRTHGVSGTPSEQILARPQAPAQAGALAAVPGSTDPERGFVELLDLRGEPVGESANPNHRVWAYHWGAMTSGGWRKALWAVLLPFGLINTAYAMIPEQEAARREPEPAWAARLAKAAMHVVGLALTVLFTIQSAVLAVDLVAYQSLLRPHAQGDSTWLTRLPGSGWFAGDPLRLSLAATVLLALALALIGTITRFTKVDDTGSVDDTAPSTLGAQTGISDAPDTILESQDFHDGNPTATLLRGIHGVAAPSALLLVLLVVRSTGPLGYWWLIPLGVLVALVTAVLVVDLGDPDRVGAVLRNTRAKRLLRVTSWSLSLGAYAGAMIVAGWFLPDRLRYAPDRASLLSVSEPIWITLLVCAAFWLLLWAAIGRIVDRHRNYWQGFPASYRPWMNGYSPVAISALAVALGAGFGAGVAWSVDVIVSLGTELGDILPGLWDIVIGRSPADALVLPTTYATLSLLWGIVAAVAVLFGAAGVLAFLRSGRRDDSRWQRELSDLGDPAPGLARHRRAWWLAAHNDQVPVLINRLFWIVVVAAAVAAAVTLSGAGSAAPVRIFSAVGTLGLLLVVLASAFAIQRAIRRPGRGRTLGVLWDVASFWPREGHPVVPPSYATVVIHDIVTRVEDERRRDPDQKIVLCGHSQGSLIMYAVALRLINREGSQQVTSLAEPTDATTEASLRWADLSLVTYGSQLRWIYGRAFPAHLGFHSHHRLQQALNWRWLNLIRTSDPVGGSVLSWNLSRADGRTGLQVDGDVLAPSEPGWRRTCAAPIDAEPLPDSGPPRIRYLPLGCEIWLPDPPPVAEYSFSRGHSNYPRDPVWPSLIADLVTRDSP